MTKLCELKEGDHVKLRNREIYEHFIRDWTSPIDDGINKKEGLNFDDIYIVERTCDDGTIRLENYIWWISRKNVKKVRGPKGA